MKQLLKLWPLFLLVILCEMCTNKESSNNTMAFRAVLPNSPGFTVVDEYGDTLIVTQSLATKKDSVMTYYTYSYPTFDTVWKRKGDTTSIPIPPNPPAGGLTGYGTVVSYNPFTSLNSDQLGKGKLEPNPNGTKDTVFAAIVNKGDQAVSSGFRSEQNWSTTPVEGGVEFDIMFVTVTQNALLLQIHGGTSGTSGPVSIWFSGSNALQVVTSRVTSQGNQNKYYSIPNFTYSLNRWYHFRVEYFLSTSGYYRVIIDGVQKLSISDYLYDANGSYGKIGINSWRSDGSLNGGAPNNFNVKYNSFYIFKK
jgi:hypothetical protein